MPAGQVSETRQLSTKAVTSFRPVSSQNKLHYLISGKDVEKFEDITRERLEFTFHSNILAYFSVAQAAVPHIPKGGAIININSIQGYQPAFGVLDYACTKVSWLAASVLLDTAAIISLLSRVFYNLPAWICVYACCHHVACI